MHTSTTTFLRFYDDDDFDGDYYGNYGDDDMITMIDKNYRVERILTLINS